MRAGAAYPAELGLIFDLELLSIAARKSRQVSAVFREAFSGESPAKTSSPALLFGETSPETNFVLELLNMVGRVAPRAGTRRWALNA